jgi:hypothetical protein
MRYVRPHLEFASPAWNPWLVKDIEILEKVQKRAVNMIGGLKSVTYEGKLKELNMQSLADRRKEADMVMMFKVIRDFCPVNKNYWPKLATEHGDNTHATRGSRSI